MSIYRWKGNIEQSEEALMLMKTVAEKIPALTARIAVLHPYEVPEIITLDIHENEGNPAYLAWIGQSVSD
jgi:periplasmic divalent cation tolerance protein